MNCNEIQAVKAVIFDLDGTLLNTLEDLQDAVNHALAEYHMPLRTLEEIRSFVGNGIDKLMERAVPEGKAHPDFDAALACMKAYYAVHCKDKTCPYEGILPLLEELRKRGMKLAIVSNKTDAEVKVLSKEYFGDYFIASIGEMAGVDKKPAPDTALKALEELGVSKEQAVYVGDSDVDVKTAQNAGLRNIAVTWGFRSRSFLEKQGAEEFIDSPMELLEFIPVKNA